MINWTLALVGATAGLLRFRYADTDTPQTVAAIDRAQDRVLHTLTRLCEADVLGGWRYVPGVALAADGE